MGSICCCQKSMSTHIPDRLEHYLQKIIEVKNKDEFVQLYSQVEDSIFLTRISFEQYKELLFQLNNDYKIESEKNKLKIVFSIIDDKLYETFIIQLMQIVQPPIQNEDKEKCKGVLKIIYQQLKDYNLITLKRDLKGIFRVWLFSLGLLFCKGREDEKLKFFFDMFKKEKSDSKEEFLVVDSLLNELLLPLVYISTYSLSSLVCKEQNFDFEEVHEEKISDNDELRKKEKTYISLFCNSRTHGKLKKILHFLISNHDFNDLTDEKVKKIELEEVNYNWEDFLKIYSEKEKEFYPFSTYLIRNFIQLHYNNV